jgi:choline dehydrogenase-like flavoprotein
MILDLQDAPVTDSLQAGICIVGAGAVGIAMALDLAASGVDVLVLEAGGFGFEQDAQDQYRGTVVNPALHPPLEEYRDRGLGGTTRTWGGRCVPFDPIDFEPRPWIAGSGWPIAYAELAPYYPAANEICDAGEFAYTAHEAFAQPLRPMIAGYGEESFTTENLERFSRPTDLGKRYREQLAAAKNLRVMLHASVVQISLDEAGSRVTGLEVRTRAGRLIVIEAKQFVLAPGGLEATRLLLASRGVHPQGIGNRHDVLGRYYMSHIAGTIGSFHASGGHDAVWHGYEVAADGTYCRRRLALRAEAQRAHRIGNFVARLHHPRIGDAAHGSGVLSALRLGRAAIPKRFRARVPEENLSGAEFARHAGNVVRGIPEIARFATHMLVKRRLAKRKFPSVIIHPRDGRFSLDFHSEQEPNYASTVRLSDERDALGMPRLVVDWRYTPNDLATVSTSLSLFAEDVSRSGCGVFEYNPGEVEREMTRYGAYGAHHIGTTRMGDDPRSSVVNRDCRVHGVHNLYVAGSSVFPTSSQANPTLTAVALGLRLADRLKATQNDGAGS